MVFFLIVSCAHTRFTPELRAGKSAFVGGDFKQAFRQLLPIAVKGCSEAEYAIGYMYYYGYGVPQDSESGIFWITRAAEQHYAPAIKALEVINQSIPENESPIPVRSRDLEGVNVNQVTVIKKVKVMDVAPKKVVLINKLPTIKLQTIKKKE